MTTTVVDPEAPHADIVQATSEQATSEHAALQILRLAAEHPGAYGRLRIARVVGGYRVPCRDESEHAALARYALELQWPLREVVRLVDALLEGALLAQTGRSTPNDRAHARRTPRARRARTRPPAGRSASHGCIRLSSRRVRHARAAPACRVRRLQESLERR